VIELTPASALGLNLFKKAPGGSSLLFNGRRSQARTSNTMAGIANQHDPPSPGQANLTPLSILNQIDRRPTPADLIRARPALPNINKDSSAFATANA
jgi:hypothetical protein